jgi:putative hemolysin
MVSAARSCLITGGRLDVAGTACALPGGKTCEVESYWAGGCGRQ